MKNGTTPSTHSNAQHAGFHLSSCQSWRWCFFEISFEQEEACSFLLEEFVSPARLYVGQVVVGVASVQRNSRMSCASFWYKDRESLLHTSHTEKELL